MRPSLRLLIPPLLLLVLTACGRGAVGEGGFFGKALEPPLPAPDFTLADQYGRPFRLSDQRGKVVLLYFGYAHCPDICPLTLLRWAQAAEMLGEEAERVLFVMVTVDPERDTPQVLRDLMDRFNPSFLGLTGSPEGLQEVYNAYGVFHQKVAPPGALKYEVVHLGTVFAIDPQGRWRLRFPAGMDPEKMAHDIRLLLGRR